MKQENWEIQKIAEMICEQEGHHNHSTWTYRYRVGDSLIDCKTQVIKRCQCCGKLLEVDD